MVMYAKIVHFIREQNQKMLIHRNKKESNNSRIQMKSSQIMATIVGLFVVTSYPTTFYYIFINSDSPDVVMAVMSKFYVVINTSIKFCCVQIISSWVPESSILDTN